MKTTPPETILAPPEVTPEVLRRAFFTWQAQEGRIEKLYDYYIGRQDFDDIHDDGNRIVSNFCAYISKTLRGYMMGNRPKYIAAEGDAYGQQIVDLLERQVKTSVDSQLALDMSRYGVAYELVYLPRGKSEPNSVAVSPRQAFVAYEGDMERDSVFGCVVYQYKDDNQNTRYRLYVYTRTEFSLWESASEEGGYVCIDGPYPHGFGRVPLIEYKNNAERTSDYEGIMDLQDAYNALLSDRQDDKDAFAQSMLFIQGNLIGTTADEIEESKAFLKKHQVLQGDEDTVASWLIKTMDETGIQVLQDQYASDIHKFAMVPDLSDEQFSGNASGVAMAYKMFGTDQMMAEKAQRFREGYKRRIKLYDYRMFNPANAEGYEPRTDMDGIDIIFQYNTPEDLSYMATALSQLTTAGIMSKATARMQLAAIPDPVEEGELVAQETAETAQAQSAAYEDPFGGATAQTEETDED